MSLRGIQRVFGVWQSTVLSWLNQAVARMPSLEATLVPAEADDVLEMDELVSFVGESGSNAGCGRPSVDEHDSSLSMLDRSSTIARELWDTLPHNCRSYPVFTDEFYVYPLIVPPQQHHPVPKGRGITYACLSPHRLCE